MVMAGAAIGLATGLISARYIHPLLYKVKPSAPTMVGVPVAVILAAMLLASLPVAMRAIQIDPSESLRTE